jgi:hypothetical protein
MAIAGGSLLDFQGALSDAFGWQKSFLLTPGCELNVLFYGLWGAPA